MTDDRDSKRDFLRMAPTRVGTTACPPNQKRRDLVRAALIGAGAVAGPWGLSSALAASSGRALINFQVLPSWMNLLAALLTEMRGHYEPDLGVRVVVIPGSTGLQAIEAMHRAPRDGGTVLVSPSNVLTMASVLRHLSVDPADDVLPIAGIGGITLGFVVGPAVPAHVRTIGEYVEWIRANPASDSYGVPGLGTSPHFIGQEMSRLANVTMRAVGYKGSLVIADDVAAGSLPAGITAVLGPDEMARHPALRLLAVAGDRRLAQRPDVPTLREAGYADAFPGESLGMFVSKGTPEAKIEQLRAAVEAALRTRPVTDALAATLLTPLPDAFDSYAMTISTQRETWRKLAIERGFTGQG